MVYFGVLQYVHAYLSAKLDSSEEAYEKVDIIPLLTSKGLISQEGLLDLGTGEYVFFYLLSGQAQPLLLFYILHLGVWVHREQTPAVHPGARLSPVSGLPILC